MCVLELVSDLTLHDSEKDLRESDCTDYDWVGEVIIIILTPQKIPTALPNGTVVVRAGEGKSMDKGWKKLDAGRNLRKGAPYARRAEGDCGEGYSPE